MKVRNGFVSNSSSSSFIIGWGLVDTTQQKEKLFSYLKKNKIKYEVVGYDDTNNYGDIIFYTNRVFGGDRIIQGGNDTEIIIPRKVAEDSYNAEGILKVEIRNDEGDGSEFWRYDPDYPEADVSFGYEKAEHIEFYNEEQQAIIKMFQNKEFFTKSEVKIGAERNG